MNILSTPLRPGVRRTLAEECDRLQGDGRIRRTTDRTSATFLVFNRGAPSSENHDYFEGMALIDGRYYGDASGADGRGPVDRRPASSHCCRERRRELANRHAGQLRTTGQLL
jgi:hypothetical protein